MSLRIALLLLLALAAVSRCCAQEPSEGGGDSGGGGDDDVDRRRRKGPWFCHGKDCPRFKTEEETPEYSLRCYERATWAVSCACDVWMPDSVLRANARVLDYVREHHLWGGTPFANVLHLHVGDASRAAWDNATAAVGAAAAAATTTPDSGPSALASAGTAAQAALEAVEGLGHWRKVVCAAYFLPNKYQGEASRAELDRRPPKPSRDSHVRIIRSPRFDAYVSGFPGFPTPARFVWQSMMLAHHLKWHGEEFDWATSLYYVYDSPAEISNRWNEVLFPARSWHELLLGEGVGEGEAEDWCADQQAQAVQ